MRTVSIILFSLGVITSGTVFSQSFTPDDSVKATSKWIDRQKSVIRIKFTEGSFMTTQPDSLNLYVIPRWRVDKMINEVVTGRQRDLLLAVTNIENDLLVRQNKYLDSAYNQLTKQVKELQAA